MEKPNELDRSGPERVGSNLPDIPDFEVPSYQLRERLPGKHNSFRAITKGGDPCFVKIFDGHRSYADVAKISYLISKQAEAQNLEVIPRSIEYGVTATGNSYLVTEFLDRSRPADLSVDGPQIAESLIKLHDLEIADQGWGWIDPETKTGRFPSWQDYILNRRAINSTRRLLNSGLLVPEDIQKLIALWPHLVVVTQKPAKGTLHGDLYTDNIIKDANGRPKFIDLENAIIGDRAYDLAVACYMHGIGDPGVRVLIREYSRLSGDDEAGLKAKCGLYSVIHGLLTVDFYCRIGLPEDRKKALRFLKRSLSDISQFDLSQFDAGPTVTATVRDVKADLHVHARLPELYHRDDEKHFLDEVASFYLDEGRLGAEILALTNHIESLAGHGDFYRDNYEFDDLGIIDRARYLMEDLRKRYPQKTLLLGAEVSIDKDGSLTASDRILRSLDLVIASIHRGIKNSPPEDYTRRVVSAIRNPYVHIIGHIGRHYSGSDLLDWDRILWEAVVHNTAIELNLSALIKDLPSEGATLEPTMNEAILSKISQYNCFVSLGSDLHSLREIEAGSDKVNLSRWVSLARVLQKMSHAGIGRERIINTYPGKELVSWLSKKR
ncbi:MAG: phosphotransferase [Patescibacteria group bacterium]|jgi:histidinol phosphatase-like PHP family hydrolase/fructosamine-3-kinase